MENTLSYITVLPSCKREIEIFSQDIISQVESGLMDPITLQIQLKAIEATVDNIKQGIKANVISQHEKNGKNYEYSGAKVSISERADYDFSNCGDSKLNEIDSQIESLKKEKKERENLLKNLKSEMADVNTGEVIYPPVKKSQTIVSITLNK